MWYSNLFKCHQLSLIISSVQVSTWTECELTSRASYLLHLFINKMVMALEMMRNQLTKFNFLSRNDDNATTTTSKWVRKEEGAINMSWQWEERRALLPLLLLLLLLLYKETTNSDDNDQNTPSFLLFLGLNNVLCFLASIRRRDASLHFCSIQGCTPIHQAKKKKKVKINKIL